MYMRARQLQALGLFLPLALFYDVALASGAGDYAVTQNYTFTILKGGEVEVQMDIEFLVSAGATLSESYKSILDISGTKSIKEGSFKVKDGLGRNVTSTLQDMKGWVSARFVFPEQVHGDGSSKYTLQIRYIVINGLCSAGSSVIRLRFPWAHRWKDPVQRSSYRIDFSEEGVRPASMNEVCLLGSGFDSGSHCGSPALAIRGNTAEYVAFGLPHGLFFQWPVQPAQPTYVTQTCPACGAACLPQQIPLVAAPQGGMIAQRDSVKASSIQTVLVVLSMVLCVLLIVISGYVGRKLKQWSPPKAEGLAVSEATLRLTDVVDSPGEKHCEFLHEKYHGRERENVTEVAGSSSGVCPEDSWRSWGHATSPCAPLPPPAIVDLESATLQQKQQVESPPISTRPGSSSGYCPEDSWRSWGYTPSCAPLPSPAAVDLEPAALQQVRVFHQEPKAMAELPVQLHENAPAPRAIGLPCDAAGISIEIDSLSDASSPREHSPIRLAPKDYAGAGPYADGASDGSSAIERAQRRWEGFEDSPRESNSQPASPRTTPLLGEAPTREESDSGLVGSVLELDLDTMMPPEDESSDSSSPQDGQKSDSSSLGSQDHCTASALQTESGN